MGLTLLFFTLFIRHVVKKGRGLLTAVFLFLAGFFGFYAVNYRTLVIQLTPTTLKLTFGLFTWNVPLDNVADYRLDDMPLLPRMGGAGIHFMMVDKRYRALFNFLEHPRVVIVLKHKVGPVQDISFSTRRPEALQRLIEEAISAKSESQMDGPLSV